MKRVYGNYNNPNEARRAVDELLEKGYKGNEIKVVSNSNLGESLNYVEEDQEKDDKNLWEKIKDAFTFDEYDDDKYWNKDLDNSDRKVLEGYRENLRAGETVVLVEEGSTSAYREHFKDGVPDWDEREEEFNEGPRDDTIMDDLSSEELEAKIKEEENLKTKAPINENFKSGINLNKDKRDRSNLNIDERKNLDKDASQKNRNTDLEKGSLNKSIGATDIDMDTMDR